MSLHHVPSAPVKRLVIARTVKKTSLSPGMTYAGSPRPLQLLFRCLVCLYHELR